MAEVLPAIAAVQDEQHRVPLSGGVLRIVSQRKGYIDAALIAENSRGDIIALSDDHGLRRCHEALCAA